MSGPEDFEYSNFIHAESSLRVGFTPTENRGDLSIWRKELAGESSLGTTKVRLLEASLEEKSLFSKEKVFEPLQIDGKEYMPDKALRLKFQANGRTQTISIYSIKPDNAFSTVYYAQLSETSDGVGVGEAPKNNILWGEVIGKDNFVKGFDSKQDPNSTERRRAAMDAVRAMTGGTANAVEGIGKAFQNSVDMEIKRRSLTRQYEKEGLPLKVEGQKIKIAGNVGDDESRTLAEKGLNGAVQRIKALEESIESPAQHVYDVLKKAEEVEGNDDLIRDDVKLKGKEERDKRTAKRERRSKILDKIVRQEEAENDNDFQNLRTAADILISNYGIQTSLKALELKFPEVIQKS